MGQTEHRPDPTRWSHFAWQEWIRDQPAPGVLLMRGWTVDHVPHTHEFGELVFVLEGRARHLVAPAPVPLRAGQLFLVLPGQRHGYADTERFLICNVLIHPELLASLAPLRELAGFAALRESPARPLPLGPAQLEDSLQLVDAMQAELFANRPGTQLMVTAQLTELLVRLCRAAAPDAGRDGGAARARISRAVAFAENHYMERLCPAQLARAAALSPRHLRRCFQAALGVTPERFILETRLRHARRLLRSSHDRIGEVARCCGFTDSNYFSRAFRQYTGRSPRSVHGTLY